MRPDERDAAYLWEMREAALAAREISETLTLDTLLASRRDQLALTKALELIGEYASRVSPAFKSAHDEVAWQSIIGMRHKLVHHYLSTRWLMVWETVRHSVPELLLQLDRLMPPIPGDDD